MFELCRIWLVALGAVMAAAGTLMVLIAGVPALAPLLRLLDRPFWPSGPDETTRRFETWSYSVTFATMAGWGICIASIAANAFATRQAWAWWTIVAALAVWYPLDTGRSLRHRVWVNATLNTILLAAAAIPLALTFGEFR
jgi:hypothetical protein